MPLIRIRRRRHLNNCQVALIILLLAPPATLLVSFIVSEMFELFLTGALNYLEITGY